jgi:hypothetical protein
MNFINRNQYLLLIFLFLATVFSGASVTIFNAKLATPGSPLKIVSLELAWSDLNANCVADSWNSELTEIAIHSIDLDFVFAFFYTLFLAIAVYIANSSVGKVSSKAKTFILISVFVAGICDAIENFYMKSFLQGRGVSAASFSLPATVKFVLLLGIVIYLAYVLHLRFRTRLAVISNVLMTLRLFAAGFITVIICYFVFIKLSQGQDILMQIAEYSGPFWFSLLCIVLFTLFIWYSSRLVGYEKKEQPTNTIPLPYIIHFPRLLAFNGIVSIQAAILSLPTIADFAEWKIWVFVVIQNALYFVWISWLEQRSSGSLAIVCAAAAAYITGILWLMFRQPVVNHELWLPLISLLLFAFGLFIVWYFVARRKKIDAKMATASNPPDSGLELLNKKLVKLPGWLQQAEQDYFKLFNLFAALGLGIYMTGFFSISLVDHMGPLAFTLLALGVLVGLSNIITVLSMRKKTNVFLLLFILALIVGRFYDPYQVRLTGCDSQGFIRPKMLPYFDKWLKQRDSLIMSRDSFPVYLVIADGGASRSGYWVSSVLSALQDSTIMQRKTDPEQHPTIFSDHLLCLAGASGGSVGNATFYSLLKNKSDTDATFWKSSRSFLKQDFLTPVITHWLGSDFLQHFIPLPFLGDRAVALEKAMEYFARDSLYATFEKPYMDVIDTTGNLPFLFINSTHVQGGAPAVVSSVQLDGFSKRVDILDSVADQNNSMIRYSTAVVLGARFPYVSPAGRIGKDYFVDGGYFDNTGAGIVHEMMQKLDSLVGAKVNSKNKRDSTLYAKLKFSLIYLSNSSLKSEENKRIHSLANDIAAPVLTVLGTYSSQTSVNNERLLGFMKKMNPVNPFYEVNLYKNDAVEYPMNWVISEYNLKRMDDRMRNSIKTELTGILELK